LPIFKKKPKLTPTTLLDVIERVRGFVLDSQIQNGHELSYLLGCSQLSDEVAEKVEQESDKRTERIEYLLPLIYTHSHFLAEASTAYQKQVIDDEAVLPDEVWQHSQRLIEQISMSTLLGSISQLVDMGLLEIPRKHRR
jgi:hypothetical protein